MGAPRADYEKHAPEHSFIHVDDFATPKELADYLHLLNSNDTLYNEYFEWKETGQFINTYFFCRLCSMLHEAPYSPPRYYDDFNEWWRGGTNCIKGSWRDLENHQRNKRNKKKLIEITQTTS
jgi:glycoprotein 3-alpha-L-fucosyltransferase